VTPDDEQLSRWIADAAPRAPHPRATADRVLARVRRRRLEVRVALAGSLAVAAAMLLFALRPRPEVARGLKTIAGPSLLEGRTRALAAGESLTVSSGAGELRVDGAAEVQSTNGRLSVTFGKVRLRGDGARAETPPARVTALGDQAEVELDVRRTPMDKRILASAAIAATTLVGVHVLHGGARVEAQGTSAPLLLGPGDRALVGAGAPPLAVRAPHTPPTVTAARAADTSAPADPQERTPSTATIQGTGLDADQIREVIRGQLNDVKSCYEAALVDTPNLSGRIMVSMTIKAKNGKGIVDEAEVIPSEEGGDLVSPSVEQCLLGVMSRAEFPAPDGDGEVLVHYPFVLLPAAPEDE
jgi:hypothetical protein